MKYNTLQLGLILGIVVPSIVFGATKDECALLEQAGYGAGCDENTLVTSNDIKLGITNSVNSAKQYLLSIANRQAGRISNPQDPHNIYRLNNTFAVCSASFLQAYNKTFGAGSAIIVSAYRDPIINAKAGGASGSRHMQGLALDINPRGGGSYQTLYEFAKRNPQFGVCFPHYGWDNPHMTLATGADSGSREARICAAQGVTKPCSGAPQFDPNQSAYGPVADGNNTPAFSPTGGGSANGGVPSYLGSNQQAANSPSSMGTIAPYQAATSTNTYTSWWQRLFGGATQQATASLSCNPTTIQLGEDATVAWQCAGASVVTSRGGVSRPGSYFATAGGLAGVSPVYLTDTTTYKVQCLDASYQVVAEDTCSVAVQGSSIITPVQIDFGAVQNPVGWGDGTTIRWQVTPGDTAWCQLKGGRGLIGEGASGTLETGPLFRSTTYQLECSTPQGTKAEQITIEVRALTS